MLGVSAGLLGNNNNNNNNTTSVRGVAADGGVMVAEPQESAGASGGSCGDIGAATASGGIIFMSEEGDNKTGSGGGGNRWPRQETLALLKIRSDMDLAFRDSSLKGPLWEQVSRKMAELGYHRNGKKCKEKFENVYKYHKRTKEGRSVKSDGKTYRFFDQLQALENIGGPPPAHQQPPPLPLPPPLSALQLQPPPRSSSPQTIAAAVTMAVPIQVVQATPSPPQIIVSPNNQHQETVSSTPQNTTTVSSNNPFTSSFPQPSRSPHPQPPQPPTAVAGNAAVPPSFLSSSPSSSSSTSSDEEIERRTNKRKRKHKDFFESLIQTVVEKQEDLQKTFLETLEKRERDRMMREEAWRVQEMARLQNEHDLLVKERTIAAERESALISLLQKMTENHQQNPKKPNNTIGISFSAAQVQEKPVPPTPNPPPPQPAVVKQSTPPPPPPHVVEPPSTKLAIVTPQPIRVAVENSPRQENNGGLDAYNNSSSATSSRWPKAEIDALINLRTHLDNKYQENGPKGPLWEEISGEMKKLGYNRNSKRCKEKWENINKYYKKVKESNKKRPEDSKTCPYFYQLDALYREKEKSGKPEIPMLPIMARPEQQWPFPQVVHHQQPQVVQFQPQHQQHQHQHQQHQQQQEHAMEEQEGENDNDDDEYDDEDEDGEDEDDDEDEGSAYEIVTNKQPSSVTSTA